MTSCLICHGDIFNAVLDLGNSPLAADFRRDRQEALTLPRYELELDQCASCSHVQLGCVVPDELLWEGDYGFYSSASSVVVEHSQAYADWIMNTMPRLARDSVVEIACNDGVLLEALLKRSGVMGLGVDPAPGPVAAARERGLRVRQQAFSNPVAVDIVESQGHAALILANNVIGHVADLHDFMAGIDTLLAPHGMLVLEFQYLGDLLAGNQIDHVYHEHRSFFSLTALQHLLAAYQMRVLGVERVDMQGGSLRVVCSRFGWPDHSVRAMLRGEERWVGLAFQGLQQRADHIRARLREILWKAHDKHQIVAAYGASAKSTTLFSFCDIGADLVRYFVDTTPAKIGRYSPGAAIPIISPEADSRLPDIYLLTVWNYARQIMRRERTRFSGDWLVPIPVPVLL
jgi:methylation protein EvaC